MFKGPNGNIFRFLKFIIPFFFRGIESEALSHQPTSPMGPKIYVQWHGETPTADKIRINLHPSSKTKARFSTADKDCPIRFLLLVQVETL